MELLLRLALLVMVGVGNLVIAQERTAFAGDDSFWTVLDHTPSTQARMPQELALKTYLRRAQGQLSGLGAYSDTMQIEAYLPSSLQYGKFQLRRTFQAPASIAYQPLRFEGDGFVKSNIILRILRADQKHMKNDEHTRTAITDANYKFSYKGVRVLAGASAYVYEVKPRKKRVGLFKGRIYVDPYSASLRRAEGKLAKSPSFFIKKVEFVQDYDNVGGFDMPASLHSVTTTRIIGRAIVDVTHTDYCTRSLGSLQAVCSDNAVLSRAAIPSPISNP